MPSMLMESFRGELKKQKRDFKEAETEVSYPMGFLPLDFKNGKKVICENERDEEVMTYNSIGVVGGSINFILGKSGLAKTTFALQVAALIASLFDESYIQYENPEGGTHFERMKDLTGWSNRRIQEKIAHFNVGVTAESFYTRTMTHCLRKIEMAEKYPEKFTYNTGLIDQFCKPLYKPFPTVIVLDSLALLMPSKLHGEIDLAKPTASMAPAKANTSIFKMINQPLKASNTILFCINHVNGDIAIDTFSQPQAQFNYLGKGKKMPGGDTPGYLANNIWEVKNGGKLEAGDTKGYGIDGMIIEFKFIKSRTNKAGQSIKLVFNQRTGFNAILSILNMMEEYKLLESRGNKGSCLPNYPDICFTKKNFFDKYYADPLLRRATKELIFPKLNEFVGDNNYVPDVVDDEALSNYIPEFRI